MLLESIAFKIDLPSLKLPFSTKCKQSEENNKKSYALLFKVAHTFNRKKSIECQKNQFSAKKFQVSVKEFQFSAEKFQLSARNFNLVPKSSV